VKGELKILRSLLIKEAATLVRGLPAKLSDFPEDMPKTTPKSVLRQIAEAEQFYREMGCRLKSIADKMTATDKEHADE
jgi:hypothetical protein